MRRVTIYAVVGGISFSIAAGCIPVASGATTRPAMSQWGPTEWTLFLGALGTFLGVAAAAVVKVTTSLKELWLSTRANAKALVPLIDANKATPETPNVDAATEATVRKTANGESGPE